MKTTTWVNIWLCLSSITIGERTTIQELQIEQMGKPGIFFEKYGEIQLIEKQWEMTTIINRGLDKYNLTGYTEKIHKIERSLIAIGKKKKFGGHRVATYKNHSDVTNKIIFRLNNLSKLEREVENSFEMLKTSEEHDKMMYYFEQMNSDEYRENRSTIDINREIIIVESSLSYKSLAFKQNDARIQLYIGEIDELRESLGESYLTLFSKIYFDIINLVNDQLNIIESKLERVKQIINKMKTKEISTEFLNDEHFEEVIQCIEKYNEPFRYPLLPNSINTKEIFKMTNIGYTKYNKKIFIKINIPLVEREAYILYKIRALPTAQYVFEEKTSTAFIKPTNDFIFINNKTYSYVNEAELNECTRVEEKVLCMKNTITLEKISSCEQTLLSNNTNTNFSNCDIQYKNNFENKFLKLETIDGWLYSTATPIKSTLHCNDYETTIFIIEGVGILSFPKNCHLKIQNNTLRVNNKTLPIKNKIIIPNTELDIKLVAKVLVKKETRETCKEIFNEKTLVSFWHIVKTCEMISKNHEEFSKITVYNIILILMTGTLIIIMTSILIFLYVFKLFLQDTPEEIELELRSRRNPESVELINTQPERAIIRVM